MSKFLNYPLEEVGCLYTRNPHVAEEYRMTLFSYTWHFTITGNSGIDTVYCDSLKDLLRLINHWNRTKEWKYVAS